VNPVPDPLVFFLVVPGIEPDIYIKVHVDRLCVLVVRVLGYRSGGPGSILFCN
jgi:hypothetical protein